MKLQIKGINRLIIEPKGIETKLPGKGFYRWVKLIIEPKGIETNKSSAVAISSKLIIEPKGIETSKPVLLGQAADANNRTKRN